MNLFTSKRRRSATVLGGAVLGLGLVASMAAPALACDTKVQADSKCGDDGGWVASFKVANDFNPDATVTSVKVDGQEYQGGVGEITQGAVAKADYGNWLTGKLDESASKESVTLTVELTWEREGKNGKTTTVTDSSDATANKPETDCTPETPPTTPTTEPTTTAPTTTPTSTPPTDTPTVPIPTPSESNQPTFPDEIFAVDCDSMTIGLDNTKGELEFKLHFTPSTGAAKDLDIKAGEKKSVTFDASEGFTVKLSIVAIYKGVSSPAETATIPYEAPDNCGSGGGASLPVTGAAAGGIAGGAAALLALGAVLFVLARRRKVKFTA